jgi:hypothetical protein
LDARAIAARTEKPRGHCHQARNRLSARPDESGFRDFAPDVSFAFEDRGSILSAASWTQPDRARRTLMKSYVLGAICVWLICGIAGAVLLGQQRVHVRTIAAGPISLWAGLNEPVDK